jgi:hypothetical protein
VGAGPEDGVTLRTDVLEGRGTLFEPDGPLLGDDEVVVVVLLRDDEFGPGRGVGPGVWTRSQGCPSNGR